MADRHPTETIDGLTVRPFEADDQPIVARLYTDGLLAGQLAPNDTGADIENIDDAYFDNPRHHFWVAEVHSQVVGMIGVASDERDTAEIRRLRVDPSYHETGVAHALLQTAVAHCKHHGYLKVVLDTRFEHDAAVDLFDHVGFQHNRTKAMQGKELLEFYLDLYRKRPGDEPPEA
ncbi:MAG: GNAT family N-acetyltransferase [Phycisphaeraceae bacterium]